MCPLTFTGADFYALCSDALLNAIKDRVLLFEKTLGPLCTNFSVSIFRSYSVYSNTHTQVFFFFVSFALDLVFTLL